jgi:hypothetical protein
MDTIIADLVKYYDTRKATDPISRILERDGAKITFINAMWIVCWLANEADGRHDLNRGSVPAKVAAFISSVAPLSRLFVISPGGLAFRGEVADVERKEILDYVSASHKPHLSYMIKPNPQ